ncbi:uncharacterized protein [Procambarus clarkii]|nr:uncharacterized protein LOC123761628 [Procambarus clarkii]
MARLNVHSPLVALVSIFMGLTCSGHHARPRPARHWDGDGSVGGVGAPGGDPLNTPTWKAPVTSWTTAPIERGYSGFGTSELGSRFEGSKRGSRLKTVSTERVESHRKGRPGRAVGETALAGRPSHVQESYYAPQDLPVVDIIGGDFVINHMQTEINREEGNNMDQTRASIHSKKEKKKKNKKSKNVIKICSKKPWRLKAVPCKVPSTITPSMTFFKINTILHRLINGECDTVPGNVVGSLRSPAPGSVIDSIPVARCDDGLVGCSFMEPFPKVFKYAYKNATIQISNETHFGFLSFTYNDAARCMCTNESSRNKPYPEVSSMYLHFEGLEKERVSSHCYRHLLLT